MQKVLSTSSMTLTPCFRTFLGHHLVVGSGGRRLMGSASSPSKSSRRLLGGRYFSATTRDGGVASFLQSQMNNQDMGSVLLYDEQQLQIAARLDTLTQQLQKSDNDVLPSDQLTTDLFSDSEPKSVIDKIAFVAKTKFRNFLQPTTTPRGLYIHGPVGTGKSFLMDLFCQTILANDEDQRKDELSLKEVGRRRRKIVRWHFHEFMLEVHSRIHQFNQQQRKRQRQQQHRTSDEFPKTRQIDPVASVALSFAQEGRILCLDEFQVTDIADAMILKRLFTMLWNDNTRVGMVVIATSNRHPNDLYEGGLNRTLFVPFIDTLHRHMEIIEMNGKQDYRRRRKSHDGSNNNITTTSLSDHLSTTSLGPSSSHQSLQKNEVIQTIPSQQLGRYFFPFDSNETRQHLEQIFFTGESGGENSGKENHQQQQQHLTRIPVRMGRHVVVPRTNENGTTCWFDFDTLCAQPLGAADYWAICEHYSTVIVDRVPQLDGTKFNEARRFVTLIDALYESKTQLILAAQVPLDQLLVHFEATVETKDGDEEIDVSANGLELPRQRVNQHDSVNTSERRQNDIMYVEGKGGSSSSAATTMIRTRDGGSMEWSATGRIGVSLAQLSTVREVSFSFQRAESRLVEMLNNTVGLGR